MKSMRRETDLIGERALPVDCYYGVQTLRAIENFDITGIPISRTPSMIKALACVKKAAARTNAELGRLPAHTGEAIEKACDEIIEGKLVDAMLVSWEKL